MIDRIPLIRPMWESKECLHKVLEELDVGNEGMVIPTEVRWLVRPRSITERRQNGEIAMLSVVLVVLGSKESQSVEQKGIKAAVVSYRVQTYTNHWSDSRCEFCCGWGHIKNKCGSKPKCGYCSCHHRPCDHKCNVAGCTSKQRSLCGHTLEKCPNCKRNHIVFSSRCSKKKEAPQAVWQSRKIELVGQGSTWAVRDMATCSDRVVLGPRPEGVAEGDEDEEKMPDVDKKEKAAGEARDVMMAVTETDIVTRNMSDIEIETETGALATIDCSDPAQLHKVMRVDHCATGDWSPTQCWCSVLAKAKKRHSTDWD